MARNRRRTYGRSVPRSAWTALALVAFFVQSSSYVGAQGPNRAQLAAWGLEVYHETVESLGLDDSPLFAETAHLDGRQSGGAGGQGYVWPLSTQFRVQNSLARLDAVRFKPLLRPYSDELHSDYWRASGGGYRSGATQSADLFYDDNAHLVVALAEAYEITGDAVFLARAEETYDYVISGEENVGGGGIYFREGDRSFKDSISTLQGARGALMLFQATGRERYLEDATRLYNWTSAATQRPDGLFMEKLFLTGPNAGTAGNFALVNSASIGISTNLEFYDATGDEAYLAEAQRIAERSLTQYFDSATGRINDEGFWAFELTDALVDLYARDGDARWMDATTGALHWLRDNKQDPNGHYGRFWGREGPQTRPLSRWHLNDQAAVARAYLYTALVPEPSTCFLGILTALGLGMVGACARGR